MKPFWNLFLISLSLSSCGISTSSRSPEKRPSPSSPGPGGSNQADFEGIVALDNCSGSLVRFDDSEPSDQALVMTNGHCVRLIPSGQFDHDVSSTRQMTLFGVSTDESYPIQATRLVYGTMTQTDVAFYELRRTYSEIEAQTGVRPLTIHDQAMGNDEDISVISGFWRRIYNCRSEATIYKLLEAEWTFNQSIRYSRPGCETIGGTSGSPVILAGTRTAIAVNNTGNENGQNCTLNNPCEVDEQGQVTATQGYSYAQQIHWIYSCRDQQGRISITEPGCQLPGGDSALPSED